MMAVSVILPLMFFLVFMGVPIAVSIGAAALVGVYSLHGVPGFYNAALALFDGATSFPLIAIRYSFWRAH